MRQIAGVLLVIFAILKAGGLIVVLLQGSEERSTLWVVRQAVYALAAASVGWSLLNVGRQDTDDG